MKREEGGGRREREAGEGEKSESSTRKGEVPFTLTTMTSLPITHSSYVSPASRAAGQTARRTATYPQLQPRADATLGETWRAARSSRLLASYFSSGYEERTHSDGDTARSDDRGDGERKTHLVKGTEVPK